MCWQLVASRHIKLPFDGCNEISVTEALCRFGPFVGVALSNLVLFWVPSSLVSDMGLVRPPLLALVCLASLIISSSSGTSDKCLFCFFGSGQYSS